MLLYKQYSSIEKQKNGNIFLKNHTKCEEGWGTAQNFVLAFTEKL